jgi:hypothetical protein
MCIQVYVVFKQWNGTMSLLSDKKPDRDERNEKKWTNTLADAYAGLKGEHLSDNLTRRSSLGQIQAYRFSTTTFNCAFYCAKIGDIYE